MESMLDQMRSALLGDESPASRGRIVNFSQMPCCFATSTLAANSVLVAAEMLADCIDYVDKPDGEIVVDQRLSCLWFKSSLSPIGWELPPVWDAIAGDYLAADSWIRLHTNAIHHRAAAIRALGCTGIREAVTTEVKQWPADKLEDAVVAEGGCAARLYTTEQWQQHPQGLAVAKEPLIIWNQVGTCQSEARPTSGEAPLNGVRILDLTRILAGPVATRFLGAYGASVLRIDPPDLDDDANAPELSVGKQCAGLDLRTASGKARFTQLLSEADIIIHGYRPGALKALGFDQASRRDANPRLIDVSLCAYGWSGPMAHRRGFDSLVQMSSGIAAAGMDAFSTGKPHPLPVQALDHATGYLVAAAVLRALRFRRENGEVMTARLSLARTAQLLSGYLEDNTRVDFKQAALEEFCIDQENTAWGPARRLRFPVSLSNITPTWRIEAAPYQTAEPEWP